MEIKEASMAKKIIGTVRKARGASAQGKKTVSHGTHRAKRKPNSPRVR